MRIDENYSGLKDRFRLEFGTLTKRQKEYVEIIKKKAEELEDLIDESSDLPHYPERCLEESIKKLEEAVMWAVKGVTTGEHQI